MSTVSAGPLYTINGPLPEAPPNCLLATPGVLLEESPAPESRFPAGTALMGYPAGLPDLWAECAEGSDDIKSEGDDGVPTPTFYSFAVYQAVKCSFRGTFMADELTDMAKAVLRATESFGVERALAYGVPGSGSPFFTDGNLIDLTGGTAVSPGVGIAILDEAIAGTSGRQGLIHATPGSVDGLGFIPVGDGGETIELISGGGNRIVSGGGYIDPDKTFPDGGPPDTEAMMFATGPVHVYLREEIFTPPLEQVLDREMNDYVTRPERFVYAYWDTAVQFGALVDWAT